MNDHNLEKADKGDYFIKEANSYREKGAVTMALNNFERAESIYLSEKNTAMIAYIRHEKAMCYFEGENYEEAESELEKAFESYLEINDFSGLNLALIHLGEILLNQDKLDEAYQYFTIVNENVKTYKLVDLASYAYSSLANYFYLREDNFLAQYYFVLALDGIPKNSPSYSEFTQKKATCLENMFMYEKAETIYKELYLSLLATKNINEASKVMHLLSGLYEDQGKTELAADLGKKMIDINRYNISGN